MFGLKATVKVERRCRHGEDGVHASQSCLKGGTIEHVTINDFDLLLELLRFFRVDIPGNGTDLVLLGKLWILQYIVDD